MNRVSAFTYGVVCYAVFLVTFLYALGFVGDFAVPVTIDSTPTRAFGLALTVNSGLLAALALQHSVMVCPEFKAHWTRIVPEPVERSTCVLFYSIALIVLFTLWQPIGWIVWEVSDPTARGLIYALFAQGWLLVVVSTFLIDHFDLFGLRQVYLYLRGRPCTSLRSATPGPYKAVRHPLYLGWLFAF